MKPESKFSYREDIDGLRAIAVLAVLGFHVMPWKIPGGYVGVDVFFVISGFLITSILWRDLESQRFSFSNFYAKRVKRLFPALLVVLLFSAAVVFTIGLPDEVRTFGLSAIFSVFYFSNHYFLSQNDYFAEGLEHNPLLHTWSLSVEEQFYIVFPILLVLLFRKHKQRTVLILSLLAGLSLILSEVMLFWNKSASFFVMPSRFWQFMAGALIALKLHGREMHKAVMEGMALLGLAGIGYSIIFFSGDTLFPGIMALVPTLSTALVIYAGQQRGLWTSRLLSIRPARFFGKISYSLYLWHWPVIVFYKLEFQPNPSSDERMFLILLSILLGYLSWKFIEQPARHYSTQSHNRMVLGGGLVTTMAIAAIGLTFLFTDGRRHRFSEKQLSYISYLEYDADPYYRTDTCFLTSNSGIADFNKDICINFHFEKPNVLLVGDSHGAQYYAALRQAVPSVEISQVNASGCRPLVDAEGEERCTVLMELALESYVREYAFDAVILAGRWEEDDLEVLQSTIDSLTSVVENVIVLGPIIEYKQALPRILARYGLNNEELEASRLTDEVAEIDQQMKSILELTKSEYYSILNTICPTEGCKVFTENGMPIQFDGSHLTHEGAIEIVDSLVEQGFLRKYIAAATNPL